MKETIEQFLSRGGEIKRLPAGPVKLATVAWADTAPGYVPTPEERAERNAAAHGPQEGEGN